MVPDRDNFDDITITLGETSKYEAEHEVFIIFCDEGMVEIDNKYDDRFKVKAMRNIRVTHFRFKKIKSQDMLMTFDIALLELERPVPFEEYPHIRPICLPENSALDVSSLRGIMSGWGATEILDEEIWTEPHCELHRPKTDTQSVSNSLKYLENIE